MSLTRRQICLLGNLTFQEIKQSLFDNVKELVMSIKLQSYCLFKADIQSELYVDAVKPININLL